MMKRGIICLLLLTALAISSVSGLEIGINGHLTNLAFDPAIDSANPSFDGMSFPWGLDVYVNHAVDERVGIHVGFYMDPILLNSVYTLFTFQESFLTLSVGPFFGLFNYRTALLKAGISTSIKLEFPGIIFVQFRADSSIGGRLIQHGEYTQEQNIAALGFYVPFAICTLGLHTKKFSQKVSAEERIDNLYIYSFKTDIYKKNVPYKILVNFAFHQLTKTFIEEDVTTIHGVDSLVAGFEIDIFASDVITINLGLDSSVYSFGTNTLLGITNPGPGGYLFDARAGVKINVDTLIEKKNL